MLTVRVIPRLDVKGTNLVKGIHLEGLRVLGKPEQAARYYYESGADELIYVDTVASLYGRNNLPEIIKKTSQDVFIPITVEGGLRTIGDIQTVLRAGADKVALNTAAIRNPSLLQQASEKYGSSTIVISIAAKRVQDGTYEAFIENGRESTGLDVLEWVKKAETLGAGEIYLTSIDRDGTGSGYDIELVRSVAEIASIPVVACGGAGKIEHISEVIKEGCADAVSMASILHYKFARKNHTEMNCFLEGNMDFLNNSQEHPIMDGTTIPEIKRHMIDCGIPCRPYHNEEFYDKN